MDNPPRQLGRYRIERMLGRGQMGTVYLATDPVIDRAVAIKVLRARPELGPDEADDWRARFEREVQVAAKLSHPNVVGVLDVGWVEDAMFIVMEYLAGTDLQAELEQSGPLSLLRALEIGDALASALDAAHAHGIVHRDLKPANVLLRADGTAKLTDFGVAHVVDSKMTRTGMTYGTPAFMSPEQATASAIGPASDQFSLASLMYFMLTGEVPFAGSSSAAIMYRLVNEEPVPPESLNPGLPQGFSRALLRALAKNPDDRYPSCGVLAKALRCAQQGERTARQETDCEAEMTTVPEVSLRKSASGRPPPRAALSALLAFVLLAVFAGVYGSFGAAEDGSASDDRGVVPSSGASVGESSQPGNESSRPSSDEASRSLDIGGSLPRNLAERANDATQVLDDVRGMTDGIPARLLDEAHCVAVIPGVIKVGFGFGGRHGKGLVSCRTATGWSSPSFVSLTGGSFGLQIGAQSTDFVLVFNRPNATQRLAANTLTLGGDASVSAGPVGRNAEAGTDVRLKEEIFSYSRSKGLFAGVSLEGATLRIDEEANRKAYGRRVTPADLLLTREHSVTPELARFVRGLEAAAN